MSEMENSPDIKDEAGPVLGQSQKLHGSFGQLLLNLDYS